MNAGVGVDVGVYGLMRKKREKEKAENWTEWKVGEL